MRFVFWSAAAFVFIMAVLPNPPQILVTPSDKVQHALAFVALALLGWAAYPRLGLVKLVIGLSAFGALIEVAQMIPSLNRDSEALDWVADMAGVLTVIVAITLWLRMRGRGSRADDGLEESAG